MKILAIDPGYDRLGVAVLEKQNGKETIVFSKCVVTDRADSPEERLACIGKEIRALIKKYAPSALAIETLFLATNQKTAMRVAEARGVCLYEAGCASIPVYEYTPLQIKIAVTGYGRSDKRQVTAMIERLVTVPKGKRLDDEYDAIAVGLTCLASVRGGDL